MFGKLFGKFGRKETPNPFEDIPHLEDENIDPEDEVAFVNFRKTFGKVTIETVRRNGGIYLQATCGKTKLLMEHYENDLLDFPDGSNGYFFGNKLIVVTRWSDMSDAEKQKVERSNLALAVHPYPCAQLSLKVGENWGDVLVNLPHCCAGLNDESAPVDEAILIFADTADPKYLSCRSVLLPAFTQKFLQKCNVNSHMFLALDSQIQGLKAKHAGAPEMAFWNGVFDEGWKKSSQFHNKARATDLEDIPDGVYIEISSANKITKEYQND